MIYHRLEPIFDRSLCGDQCGFRKAIRIENALIVVESMYLRCNEFNLPLWIASLDLRNAFDKIEYHVLCQALRAQISMNV